jgi:hypothetical protein
LPPPKLRARLLNRLQVYAGELFKLEADQYSEFKNDPRYPAWLSRLADRVIARIFKTIEILERANEPATLAYHELTDDDIRAGLRQLLWEIANHYNWKDSGPYAQVEIAKREPVPKVEPAPKPLERKTLVDSYRTAFPDVKIADICWAAGQTRREWKRWIKGEAKDGLKPDRAFRHVLASGKRPEEIVGKPRPTKYNA